MKLERASDRAPYSRTIPITANSPTEQSLRRVQRARKRERMPPGFSTWASVRRSRAAPRVHAEAQPLPCVQLGSTSCIRLPPSLRRRQGQAVIAAVHLCAGLWLLAIRVPTQRPGTEAPTMPSASQSPTLGPVQGSRHFLRIGSVPAPGGQREVRSSSRAPPSRISPFVVSPSGRTPRLTSPTRGSAHP